MRRWREDEGRDEGRARGARVRSVGLGLGTKWAGLVGGLGGLRLERPVGSAQVERKWPEVWSPSEKRVFLIGKEKRGQRIYLKV